MAQHQTSSVNNGKTNTDGAVTMEYSSEVASNIHDVGLIIEHPLPFQYRKLLKYFGRQSKNLVSKYSRDGRSLTYAYTKDVNGNISTYKRNDHLELTTVKYNCK